LRVIQVLKVYSTHTHTHLQTVVGIRFICVRESHRVHYSRKYNPASTSEIESMTHKNAKNVRPAGVSSWWLGDWVVGWFSW